MADASESLDPGCGEFDPFIGAVVVALCDLWIDLIFQSGG